MSVRDLDRMVAFLASTMVPGLKLYGAANARYSAWVENRPCETGPG